LSDIGHKGHVADPSTAAGRLGVSLAGIEKFEQVRCALQPAASHNSHTRHRICVLGGLQRLSSRALALPPNRSQDPATGLLTWPHLQPRELETAHSSIAPPAPRAFKLRRYYLLKWDHRYYLKNEVAAHMRLEGRVSGSFIEPLRNVYLETGLGFRV